MRVLVTGASSLVGFSILESLEGRRSGLELIGIASDAQNSEAVRYDRFCLVPRSDSAGFVEILEQQIDLLEPDLVLPGRDPDIAHLAAIRDRREDLRRRIATGPYSTALLTLDKSLTARFASAHDLPWAPTVTCGPDADLGPLRAHSLPWIVKPAGGSGSHGVFLITESEHLRRWLPMEGYVIQPLLGEPRVVEQAEAGRGVAWFTDVGDPWLRSVQVVIGPTGTIAGTFCSDHTLSGGITMSSGIAVDPVAVDIGSRWARALAAAGWRGSLNIQMKVDPHLGPTPFEVNGRLSGATHGRLLLGFDEVALTLREWTGLSLPAGPPAQAGVYYRPRAYPAASAAAPTSTTTLR